jgi:hypothetical protein
MMTVYYVNDLCDAPRHAPKGGLDRGSYRKVTEVETDDLEVVFRQMNAVDGTELCCKLRVRSMSVGDVAVDAAGVAHLCCSCGWAETSFAG